MQNERAALEHVAAGQEVIDGVYRLGAVLGRSAAGTIYETQFGDEGRPAAIKIRPGSADALRLVEGWRKAMTLSHPNLLRVYAAGTAVLHESPIVYVVMERAEESLAGVLAERRLSEAEVREMLDSAVAALRYLHKIGYSHGSVKPSNVLAVGDTIKLSSDRAEPIRDGRGAEEDIRALGTVIVQSLTQEIPKAGADVQSYLGGASENLQEIVRRCLNTDASRRWPLDRVESKLRESERTTSPHSSGIPKWIYAGLGALVLVVLLLAWMRRSPSPPPVVDSGRVSAAVAPRPVFQPPPQPAKPPAEAATASANAASVNTTAADHRDRRASGWAVIIAAYKASAPADKRLRSMTSKWPKFRWTVMQQPGDKTYYFVVIGQNLSEDQATALRKRAIASGLPRDTYIKRLAGR